MHRIEKLLAEMTLEEKVAMCAGASAWHTTGCPRLDVPPMKVTDGPNGARGDGVSGATAMCFPVGSALAATFDTQLIGEVGAVLGDEARSKGAQVLLGPTVNIHRAPLGGRHFECYSEDPHLTARIAVAFVNGVQSRKIGTSIKHYVCNDSEFERFTISSEVGERALREIYLTPFEAAVREANTWSVMSAYNRINGIYASSHHALLTGILKDEWGFEGFVVSDWGASRETVENANGGLDLEMPGPARTMGDKLLEAVKAGDVAEATVDDKVRRLLRITIATGKLDAPEEPAEQSIDLPEQRALARRVAADGMVLVRNEGVLPLDRARLKKLAVIGPNAERGMIQGGGSSFVKPHYQMHPLAALREAFGEDVEIVHEHGCSIEKFVPNIDSAQLRPANGEDRPGLLIEYWNSEEPPAAGDTTPPVLAKVVNRTEALFMGKFAEEVDPESFCVRYSGTFTPTVTGPHVFGIRGSGRARLLVDEALVVDNWSSREFGDSFFGSGSEEKRGEVELNAGEAYLFRVEFNKDPGAGLAGLQFGLLPPRPANLLERAVAAAADADVAILVVGTNGDWETEGNDRTTLALPGGQDDLIAKVIAANPNTVVVMNAGSPVEMPWFDAAPALLQVWFPGQEFGHALCDVLLGDVNPSGRMPTTWPRRIEDTPAFTNYPGENGAVSYGEGLFVGYRWYEARKIEPMIPFGHGLSYTRFEYGPLTCPETVAPGSDVTVSIAVTNAGERAGQEVVQLYVGNPDARLARAPRELRAFEKLHLEPGEEKRVTFILNPRALSYWNPATGSWTADPGRFTLEAGPSSADTRSRAEFTLSR